jgi:nuclear pore complex protein Nup210
MFVETTFDPMYFRVDYSSPNGTYHIGVPIRGGSAYVTSVLKKIMLVDGSELHPSPQPRVRTEMEIFQNIALNPKQTILPWDPNIMPKYDLRWNPSGGNGNFVWSSSNTSVVTVSQSATGKTEWLGSANITASSSVNPNIKGLAQVYVLPPTRMAIVEHIVEAEVGTAIQVPLAFYTIRPNDVNRTEVPYSSCKELPFKVVVQDHPNFLFDDKTHYPNLKPACVVLPIMGNALGSSLVTVSYSVGDKYFEDSVTVSTFKPLKVKMDLKNL